MQINDITQSLVREHFDYNKDTGVFVWKKSTERSRIKPGTAAGTVMSKGYTHITFLGFRIYAHRMAWLYVYGSWPEEQIDHINGDRNDNRIDNLRPSWHSANAQNRNAIGGWVKLKRNLAKSYQAKIVVDGRRYHLGYYATEAEAVAAYRAAKRIVHLHNPIQRS